MMIRVGSFVTPVGITILIPHPATIKTAAAAAARFKADVSGNIGLGVQLYITGAFSMRIDYRQYLYASETGGLAYPAELTVGFSLWTAAPK